MAVCHSERGFSAVEAVKPHCKIFQEARYEQVVTNNGGFKVRIDALSSPRRKKFFEEFNATQAQEDAAEKIREFTKLSFLQRLRKHIPNPLRRLLRFALEMAKLHR